MSNDTSFAAYVAHELRTPIAFQRTLVEVTLADPDADATELRAMGEALLAACERQQRLIDALLDLTRSRHGLSRREPIDLAAVAHGTLQAQHADGIDCVAALGPCWTRGDPDLVERLVANLVSNAIRHNITDGRVEVATGTRSGRANLSVTNTGAQIPPAELRQLFLPFRRLAPHDAEGAGLGLAIVRAIADAHHATLTARARAEGGLEIRVGFAQATV